MVLGVQEARTLHPRQTILLVDVDDALFWGGILDGCFRAAGVSGVFLEPDSEQRIQARPALGSIERFIAILLEHCAGAFPLWLAPVQLRVLTVTDDHKEYAGQVVERFKADGWRVEFDGRNEKLGYKIREAQLAKVPYAVIIGDKEVAAESVAPRRRGGENIAPLPVAEFIKNLHAEVKVSP